MEKTAVHPILCGTDFSVNARAAAEVAAALALRLGETLILTHSLDERGEIPAHLRPALIPALQPQLAQEAQRLRALGAEVEEQLVNGVPDDGLVALAVRSSAELIVVASSGTGALGRWMLGSVAERTAESAPLPTLIVRDAAPFTQWLGGERPLKVFVAADFSPNSEAALRRVAAWQKIAPCEISVGFVDLAQDEKRNLEDELRASARRLLGVDPARVEVRRADAEIGAQLLQLASAAGAALIVSGTHQWHGASRLAHASVSRQLLRHAPVSIACVPLPAP